eukprot:snap_masked-scaffold_17-processed-gene-4.14-mRNA-1 protein AED:1.00 eAED:1.00 QI:0/0/0/0/1/1/2/0/82
MEKDLNPSSSSSRAEWGGRAESWGPFLKMRGHEGLPATLGSVHFTLFPAPSLFCPSIGNYCSAHRLFRRSIMTKILGNRSDQ